MLVPRHPFTLRAARIHDWSSSVVLVQAVINRRQNETLLDGQVGTQTESYILCHHPLESFVLRAFWIVHGSLVKGELIQQELIQIIGIDGVV